MKNKKRKLFKVNYIHYFEPIDYIINLTEIRYYNDLVEIADKYNFLLLSKVSIRSMVKIKNTLYKWYAAYQCGHEVMDFVLVDKKDGKTIVCISLDDPYYLTEKQNHKRKVFIDELFDILNVKLIRVNITDEYAREKLENKIKNMIISSQQQVY